MNYITRERHGPEFTALCVRNIAAIRPENAAYAAGLKRLAAYYRRKDTQR